MTPANHAAVFLREAEDLLSTIEEIALTMGVPAPNEDALNQLFRAFHTLKGSGAMFGFEALAQITHHIETALDQVRSGRLPLTQPFVDCILLAKDELVEVLAEGPLATTDSARHRALMQQLAALVEASSPEGADPKHLPDAPAAARPVEHFVIRFQPNPNLLVAGSNPVVLLDELRALGACEIRCDSSRVPPLDQLVVDQCYLGWEVALTTDRGYDTIRDIFIFVEEGAELTITRQEALPGDDVVAGPAQESAVRRHVASASQAPLATALPVTRDDTRALARRSDSMVRVPAERLDRLVNLVGELVMNQSRLNRVAARLDVSDLTLPVEEIERLVGELRDSVLGIRMMPIGSTFARFKRLVHDLSAELGKEIDLVTEGAETELDKTVLDQLGEPLVHLIRNSLDHGIESPADRRDADKPPRGTIRLAAQHTGSNVVVTISDDGRGLDVEAIRGKALERGLIGAEAKLPPAEVYKLIFLPGFSTAKNITAISGRGVGMDVVKKQIEALRGVIQVASEPGRGTAITLTLPLTLAIIEGLLVEIAGDPYILPMPAVLENVELSRAQRLRNNGRNVIAVRGELVPYVRLRDTFFIGGECADLEKVVILRHGAERVGLVVDRVIGSHQTVIQSLGRFYRDVELVSGATIMGDGRVALILDVGGLLRHDASIAAAASQRAPRSA